MYIRVLGAAAGGGFPQWNCSCSNCQRLRLGTFCGNARSQAQLAVSADAKSWFLVGASPDLRYQIESFEALHPSPDIFRNSPISGLILLSAEIDAALGLLLLRESQPITVYSTPSVKGLLTDDNNFFQVLRRQADQVKWRSVLPNQFFELQDSGIRCRPVSAGGGYPGHVPAARARALDPAEAVLGLFLEHAGHRIAFFPGVQAVDAAWLDDLSNCDVIFIDGTFWSDDELIRIQGHGKTAREMGHAPVFGENGTIDRLSNVAGPRKIFIHINNTNPMLDEDGPEYRHLLDAGWELAFDGMEFAL